ncbi:MAG: DUF4430 domain-containing protein [Eubacterium sp.]|nr:DUF4430 domain-containing protein [Eubacterium sp.]
MKNRNKYLRFAVCLWLCLLLGGLISACNAGVITNEPSTEATATQAVTDTVHTEAAEPETVFSSAESTSLTEADTTAETATETTGSTTAAAGEHSTRSPSTTAAKTTAPTTTATPTAPKTQECTLTIDCTAALANKDKLVEGHENVVPSDGYLLRKTAVTIQNGDTVYDVLKRACSANGISINGTKTYIRGLQQLDEFDCGTNSGWLYYVNGELPMTPCGKYAVSSGDNIVFYYTVDYSTAY